MRWPRSGEDIGWRRYGYIKWSNQVTIRTYTLAAGTNEFVESFGLKSVRKIQRTDPPHSPTYKSIGRD